LRLQTVLAYFEFHIPYLVCFLPARKRGNIYGNVAGWLGGWLSVCHSQYCIKTTKPILKRFGPSGSPII